MNNPTIQPYLFFDGRCEEAIEYYKATLGAEVVMLLRFKDNPEPPRGDCPPSPPDKVMHAQVRIGNMVIMMSDGRCGGAPRFEGFALTLNVANEAEADKAFNALAQGGEAMMPLEKTFFSPRFGMVTDKMGVFWMVLTEAH
jgi:PhnB protein